ncbi:MAG: response regulator [Lachnospiraceae bacterium]|nr:response regulator [Lachnospiraceae bacterium]
MKQVVLIDDNPLILASLEKTIDWALLDCRVAGVFPHAEEGRSYCLKNPVDLVITDIKMPEITGLEILEELRRKKPQTKGIVITGFNEFEYARSALRIGVIDLILKPIDNEELAEAVKRTFGIAEEEAAAEEQREKAENHFSKIEIEKQKNCSVRRALAYMKENSDKKLSLGELADYVGLSAAHLSRLLKKETGKNFVDINNEFKIEKSLELLKEGKYKIYEISNIVGIDNYAYFYQLFKKITGKSPKEYQNS